MKKLYSCISSFFCLAAALLTSNCTADSNNDAWQQTDNTAIQLGATVKGTRAGAEGSIDYSTLARTDYGFGVYAYGPTASDYSTTLSPNLFANTKVSYTGNESTPVDNTTDLSANHENSTKTEARQY